MYLIFLINLFGTLLSITNRHFLKLIELSLKIFERFLIILDPIITL
ncbi:uncharacterized protein METZ01_LOCUS441276 [marine metagenome]|uniref:Uncharacterized protein n=1 Tax=marine metagenome TaxID=408172 RepID=A0A382YYT2_9ZZZZ